MRQFLIIVLTTLTLVACSKVTHENYEKLKSGQDLAEVEAMIGKAGECSSALGAKSCKWRDGDKEISIKFVADKVVLYSKKGF